MVFGFVDHTLVSIWRNVWNFNCVASFTFFLVGQTVYTSDGFGLELGLGHTYVIIDPVHLCLFVIKHIYWGWHYCWNSLNSSSVIHRIFVFASVNSGELSYFKLNWRTYNYTWFFYTVIPKFINTPMTNCYLPSRLYYTENFIQTRSKVPYLTTMTRETGVVSVTLCQLFGETKTSQFYIVKSVWPIVGLPHILSAVLILPTLYQHLFRLHSGANVRNALLHVYRSTPFLLKGVYCEPIVRTAWVHTVSCKVGKALKLSAISVTICLYYVYDSAGLIFTSRKSVLFQTDKIAFHVCGDNLLTRQIK